MAKRVRTGRGAASGVKKASVGEEERREAVRAECVGPRDVVRGSGQGGRWTQEQVDELAEEIPELYVEYMASLTDVAVALRLGSTRARAIGVMANLVKHHAVIAKAVDMGKRLMTDEFAKVAVGIGLGKLTIRNNYPGMKWLEAHAGEDWSPAQKVQVENTGFSADDLRAEERGGGGGGHTGAAALKVLSGGASNGGRDT